MQNHFLFPPVPFHFTRYPAPREKRQQLEGFLSELIFLTVARLLRFSASSDLDAVFCSSSHFLWSTSPLMQINAGAINGAGIQ